MDELPRYFTAPEAAHVTGIDERKIRNWQLAGLIRKATTKGALQYHRADVIRCSVLSWLQLVFGEHSTLAFELAQALTPDQLDEILAADAPRVEIALRGLVFKVQLIGTQIAQVRERMQGVLL